MFLSRKSLLRRLWDHHFHLSEEKGNLRLVKSDTKTEYLIMTFKMMNSCWCSWSDQKRNILKSLGVHLRPGGGEGRINRTQLDVHGLSLQSALQLFPVSRLSYINFCFHQSFLRTKIRHQLRGTGREWTKIIIHHLEWPNLCPNFSNCQIRRRVKNKWLICLSTIPRPKKEGEIQRKKEKVKR